MSALKGRAATSLKPGEGPLRAVHKGGFLERTVIAAAPPHGRSEPKVAVVREAVAKSSGREEDLQAALDNNRFVPEYGTGDFGHVEEDSVDPVAGVYVNEDTVAPPSPRTFGHS